MSVARIAVVSARRRLNNMLSNISCIYLVGVKSLYTELILEYLGTTFNIEIKLISLNDIPKSPNTSDLILFNYPDVSNVDFDIFLIALLRESESVPIAFINMNRDIPLFEIIEYPNIKGIFIKDDPKDVLIKGIISIDQGDLWIPRKYVNYLGKIRSGIPGLTEGSNIKLSKKELEVMELIFGGRSNQEIADEMNISPHTVKTHLYKVYKKIGVKNRTQAVQWLHKTKSYSSFNT